ncbi:MAG: protein prkA, partial [Alicyclobacillus sp.]|nr:protein prkA [Alicyclobacillus sp.]
DEVLNRVVEEYFLPAARGYDLKRRLLLLVGPVSSGKSTFVQLLERGLERFTQTDEGAVYAIEGCPMQQNPLLLLPPAERTALAQELGIRVEGELNPYTRWMVETKYGGDIAKVRVVRVYFSEQKRLGIGTFSPSDPKSQDISELVGSLDFVGLAQYGSESDPRAYRFDGELNIANRGLMEFQEILKCDEKFLYPLLSLTQEGNFKTGRYALISADEVIVAHTNEAEYERFVNNPRNEALLSRMFVLRFPYHRSVAAEVRMLQARVPGQYEPYALETTATFTVETRSADGMRGIDPRFVVNCLSAVVCNTPGPVEAFTVLRALRQRLPEIPGISEQTLDHYLGALRRAAQAYQERISELVFASLDVAESERQMLDRYLQQVQLWADGAAHDAGFLEKVEDLLAVPANGREAFRESLLDRQRRARELQTEFHLEGDPAIRQYLCQQALQRIDSPVSVWRVLQAHGFSAAAAERLTESLLNPVNPLG